MKLRSLAAWTLTLSLILSIYWISVRSDLEQIQRTSDVYVRKQALLERLTALPEKERLIKDRLADLRLEAAKERLYSGTDSEIQSYIQLDIRQLASNAQVNLSNMRPIGVSESGKEYLEAVKIQASLTTTHEKLVAFLGELERANPMLKVSRMTVRVQRSSTISQAAILSVGLDIVGFREKGVET